MPNEDFSYASYCEKFINVTHSPILVENSSSGPLVPIKRSEDLFWINRLNQALGRNMTKPKVLIEGNKDGNFFSLTYKGENDENTNFLLGWKFHIAVDDSADNNTNESNLRCAWNIIKDILIKHKIREAKVVTPNGHFSSNHQEKQYGKQITIYACQDRRADDCAFWQRLLQEIEFQLHLANIQPDPNRSLCQDLQISGTGQYCSYRNDLKIQSSKLGYLYGIKYLKELSPNLRGNYTVFNNLEDLDRISAKHFPVNNVEVSEIPRLLSADPYLSPVDLAKFLSHNRVFSVDEITRLEALDKPWRDQRDLISARQEMVANVLREKFAQEKNAEIIRSSFVQLNEIDLAQRTDPEIITLRSQEEPMAIARLEEIRKILSLPDPMLNSVGELYQALSALSLDNRIIDFSNRLCMNPENLYEYSLLPNGSGLQDPYARMTLYKPEPSMMSKIWNCCCSSADAINSNVVPHDNIYQEPIDDREKVNDHVSDTSAISTALSTPDGSPSKKKEDLLNTSILVMNSSSEIIENNNQNDQIDDHHASYVFGKGTMNSTGEVISQNTTLKIT